MSRAKYVPSDWAVFPKGFGKVPALRWKALEDATNDQMVEYEAARLQHAFAVAIREAIDEHGLDLSQFARRSHQDYGRFTSVLRGAVVMRLEDVARCQLALNDLARKDLGEEAVVVDVRGRADEVMSKQEGA